MKIDLSIALTRNMIEEMKASVTADSTLSEMDLFGHLGTHFDIMDQEFDTENFERRGLVFDVSETGQEVEVEDVNLSDVREGDFVMFHTSVLKEKGYGTQEYFASRRALSWNLIERLVKLKVSMIGVDAAGIRMRAEHPKADKFCADNGVFVVENLDKLDLLLSEVGDEPFSVGTYPMNFSGSTGLPCRVIAHAK
jgi:kynurenine formamidase